MAIDEHALARVGMVLDEKYTLHRLIGCGGMATVYEASHRNGHRVAIKILHADLAERDDVRDRFLREGYVANKVEHPGAVRVLDDDVAEDGSVYLVMELLEGATLDERCKQAGGSLPVGEVCVLAHHVLEVLAAAHAKGVVHRDIKPENVFLTNDGALKVLDFGIARLLENAGQLSTTRTGALLGTPAFMAPEQALGHSSDVDGQSDLWAVGATMFALASGHLVHDAETMQEMMVRAGSMHARSVRSVARHVPPRIAEVIDRALAFHKVDRWADAWSMGENLQDAYRQSFGVPILSQWASLHPPSMRPTSRPPTAVPVAPVLRIPCRPPPPISTTVGLSRERPKAIRRSGARAFALVLVVLGSVVAGIVVASRKEPAPAVVVAPPPPLLPVLLPAIPSSELLLPKPVAAVAAPDAAPAGRDAAGVVDAAASGTVMTSASSRGSVLHHAPASIQPVFVPAIRPVEIPPVAVSNVPSLVPAATPSAAPSSAAAAAPSASASPDTTDPIFGL